MEERTIKVTFKKAVEWYNSGNTALQSIALQAFSKEELEMPTLQSIINTLRCRGGLTKTQLNQLLAISNRNDYTKISAPKLLRILAMYYNNGWNKEVGNTGYFLSKREYSSYMGASGKIGDDWSIIKHESVFYPLPYFKSESDCKKAFNYLKSLGKLDDLYSDF